MDRLITGLLLGKRGKTGFYLITLLFVTKVALVALAWASRLTRQLYYFVGSRLLSEINHLQGFYSTTLLFQYTRSAHAQTTCLRER